jgi:plastocyanin
MRPGRQTVEEDRLYNAIVRTARAVILPAALIISIALLAYACGGGGGDDSGDNGDNGADGPVSFDVSMGDNFFEPKEFTVKTGQKVTFNLKNDGAAIHNMRVAGADNEYNTDDDALSDPSQFSPGDTGTLEWTAPDKAGEIDLKCEFHPTDSTGIIKVE